MSWASLRTGHVIPQDVMQALHASAAGPSNEFHFMLLRHECMMQGETSEELRCLSSLGHEELTDSELVLQAASILAPSHAQDMDICSAAPQRRGSMGNGVPSRDSSASVQSASPQLQQALAAQPGQAALSLVKIEGGTESQTPLAAPAAARPCPGHAAGLGKAWAVPAVHSLAPEHLPMLPASHPQVKQEAKPTTAGPEAAADDNDGKGIKRNRTHQKDYTQRKRVHIPSATSCLLPLTSSPELLQQAANSNRPQRHVALISHV